MVSDFELKLSSVTVRMYDDGRFIVLRDGQVIFDKDRTGRFPQYEQDIKPKLS